EREGVLRALATRLVEVETMEAAEMDRVIAETESAAASENGEGAAEGAWRAGSCGRAGSARVLPSWFPPQQPLGLPTASAPTPRSRGAPPRLGAAAGPHHRPPGAARPHSPPH